MNEKDKKYIQDELLDINIFPFCIFDDLDLDINQEKPPVGFERVLAGFLNECYSREIILTNNFIDKLYEYKEYNYSDQILENLSKTFLDIVNKDKALNNFPKYPTEVLMDQESADSYINAYREVNEKQTDYIYPTEYPSYDSKGNKNNKINFAYRYDCIVNEDDEIDYYTDALIKIIQYKIQKESLHKSKNITSVFKEFKKDLHLLYVENKSKFFQVWYSFFNGKIDALAFIIDDAQVFSNVLIDFLDPTDMNVICTMLKYFEGYATQALNIATLFKIFSTSCTVEQFIFMIRNTEYDIKYIINYCDAFTDLYSNDQEFYKKINSLNPEFIFKLSKRIKAEKNNPDFKTNSIIELKKFNDELKDSKYRHGVHARTVLKYYLLNMAEHNEFLSNFFKITEILSETSNVELVERYFDKPYNTTKDTYINLWEIRNKLIAITLGENLILYSKQRNKLSRLIRKTYGIGNTNIADHIINKINNIFDAEDPNIPNTYKYFLDPSVENSKIICNSSEDIGMGSYVDYVSSVKATTAYGEESEEIYINNDGTITDTKTDKTLYTGIVIRSHGSLGSLNINVSNSVGKQLHLNVPFSYRLGMFNTKLLVGIITTTNTFYFTDCIEISRNLKDNISMIIEKSYSSDNLTLLQLFKAVALSNNQKFIEAESFEKSNIVIALSEESIVNNYKDKKIIYLL